MLSDGCGRDSCRHAPRPRTCVGHRARSDGGSHSSLCRGLRGPRGTNSSSLEEKGGFGRWRPRDRNLARRFRCKMASPMPIDLTVEISGLRLANPILASSGTFGYGLEFSHLVDLNRLGGLVVKGLSLEPMDGAPAPRICETASGMLNAIGLQNVGVRAFVTDKLPSSGPTVPAWWQTYSATRS